MVLLFVLFPHLETCDKVLQLLSRVRGSLLVGLGLLDRADGVLDSPVGTLDNLLCLLLGLFKNLLLGLPDAFKLLLVAFGDVLQSLVRVLYPLQLLVQGPAVAHDPAQVSLHSHELLSGPVLGILHDVLGKSHLAGQLECERVARHSDVQLEQRLDLGRVELHCAVDDTSLGSRSVELEVRVVRRDDSVDPSVIHLA